MATILIVDDISANRQFLVTILRHHGHELIEAVDGREGLAAVHTQHVDLVITDVLMPVMDGFELVRQLRLDPITSVIPVIFYTAHYGAREARALALSVGVSDVLTKPAETAEVLTAVNCLLSEAPAMDTSPVVVPPGTDFDREHLRLLTDKLSEKAGDLGAANARLRGLINIGLELASERDADRLLQSVCLAARDLFGATYVTLGILDLTDRTVLRAVTCGAESAPWIKTGDSVSGLLKTVVVDRRTLRGRNLEGDPVRLEFPPFHPEVQAFLAAPIASPANVYGWLCLVGNEGRAFTEDDEHLVVALSGQVGRIYENCHFNEIALKRAAELEHEVVERRQAESALRQERDRAQRYLDTAGVILLSLDLEGRVTLVNRKGCDILGWTERELLGRDWIETCLPYRLREGYRQKFAEVLLSGLPTNENPVLTKSGEERLIEWCNTVLRDDTGHVVGTFSSGTDVSARYVAAASLRIAEERVRFALESAGVGIWDMNFTTGTLQWSDILESQYGLLPGTFGQTFDSWLERVHPDDRVATIETVNKARESGADFSIQNRSLWPDGSVRWLTGAGRIQLGEHGHAVRGVGISLDVTERHALQEQYHQAQKMEAVGQLAGGVAHDFNNLLTVILGYCEILLGDFSQDDPRRADIVEIEKAGASAAGLTRQLLAFSRKEIIEPAVLDLSIVVADMRAMLGRLIREDVKVVLALGRELAGVKADRGQVEQIIVNLAVNARDAMPKGGTLTIEIATVDLDEQYATSHLSVHAGPYVVLTVSDTGTGMTAAVQTRLFEPFFTTKPIGTGTGLGLATVYGIVKRSGGSLNVYSEVGMGSSFKVYFPRVDAGEIVVETPAPVVRRRASGQTVLVVEDAAGLRDLAKRLLERQGYAVLVAASADEAYRLSEENPSIDVLLTDVVMPGGSGPDVAQRLVERRPRLKVIYMSGYTKDAIVHHGVLTAGIAFLHKPFTAEALGRKIIEVLGQPQ